MCLIYIVLAVCCFMNVAAQSHIEALYKNHHSWLYQWLRKRLGCAENAADVAHDTFIRVLTSQCILSDINEPRAFLTTTAKNLLIDKARRKAIEEAFMQQLQLAMQESPDNYPAPDLILSAIELLEQLSYVLSKVSDKAATAFRLHYLDGMKQSVVASTMGVSSRTVRSYLTQVLVELHLLDIAV